MSILVDENLELLLRSSDAVSTGKKSRNLARLMAWAHDLDDLEPILPFIPSLAQLIKFYGLLEIASMAGLISTELPADVVMTAKAVLNCRYVRMQYEDREPHLLAQLFRERVDGQRTIQLPPTEEMCVSFIGFLDLSRTLDEDPDIQSFASSLGSFDRPSTAEEKLLLSIFGDRDNPAAVFEDPEGFVNEIAQPGQATWVRGLLKFLTFSRDFSELLAACAKQPTFQSALCHHHQDWYQHRTRAIEHVVERAARMIAGSTGWPEEAKRSLIEWTDTSRDTLRRLSPRRFEPLIKVDHGQAEEQGFYASP